jgi:tetratricopeptide (TPR) repeat protein
LDLARPTTAGAERRGKRRALCLLAAILLVTVAVYARSLAGELVYDDRLLIARNPLIADPVHFWRLFTSGYWEFLGLEAQEIGYWRPLTAIVQAAVFRWAGSAPLPYHAACLAVHLCASALAFALARRLTGSPHLGAGVALVFALHPAHVESVAWISALNDPLFGACALLAVERHLAWRQRGSRGFPLGAALALALALLSKELGAAVLPLVGALDLCRTREPGEDPGWSGGFHAPARAYGALALVFLLYLLGRMLVFASPYLGFEREVAHFGVGVARMLALRIEVFGGALEILLLPLELNLFRPFRPHIAVLDPALVRGAVFTALFAALALSCLLGRRRLALFALLVVPCGLLPALVKPSSLGIFPLSERFLYLPVFGFALLVVPFLAHRLAPRSATALVCLLAGLYAARTVERCGFFRDEETLFRRAAAQSPRSVYVRWGLGRVLLERFNETRDPRLLQEAFRTFEAAQDLLVEAKSEPTDLFVTSRDYLQVNLGLALCYVAQCELDPRESPATAIAILDELERRITRIQQEEREARALGIRVRDQYLDLERVQAARGAALRKAQRPADAEQAFRAALALQPAFAEAHLGLGRLLAEQGRWAEAEAELAETARLWPGNAEARLALAQTLQMRHEGQRAEELALALLDELPRRAEPLSVLAAVALERGDSTRALAWLDRALRVDPRNGHVWYQRARALLLRGEGREALSAFRNAVELAPTHFEAHYDLGAFLLSSGAVAEALPVLLRAYALAPPEPKEHRAALRATLERQEFDAAAPLFELALADWGRGELEAVLAWCQRALALDARHADALLLQARALRRLERHDQALAALRQACQLAPESFGSWSELAFYLDELGRGTELREVLEHALALEPPVAWPDELRASSLEGLRALQAKLAAPDGD